MNDITVNYGNVYYKNSRLRRAKAVLRRGRPDAIVVNEGGRVRRFRGYRQYVDPHAPAPGRTDVRVFVRKDHDHLGTISLLVEPEMKRFPAAHERFAVAALFHVQGVGNVAVVGFHPSPGPKALVGDGSHPLAIGYEVAILRLGWLLDFLDTLGYRILLAGDVQLHEDAPDRDWNPYSRLRDAGYEIPVSEHLDLIATGRGLDATEARLLEGRGSPATGSDHPFLTVTAKRRARRKAGRERLAPHEFDGYNEIGAMG